MIQTLLWVGLKDYDVVAASKELTTCDMSNETLIKRFLANKMLEGCSPRTLQYYGDILRRFTIKCPKSFIQIEAGDVKAVLALRMSQGLSLTDCDNWRRTLSSFFTWMHDEAIIATNPMKRVKKIKRPKVLREPFSYGDVEKIRSCCKTTRDRAIVEVLLSTACRVSEVADAKLSNLQLQNGTLKVVGKGNKERIVYLNAAAKLWLGKYLDERTDSVDAVFIRQIKWHGEACRISLVGIEHVIKRVGKMAGVPKCHPHRFRRTAATWASRRGMKLEQIQKMLGHEQIETTTIHTSVSQKDVQIAHERYLGGD